MIIELLMSFARNGDLGWFSPFSLGDALQTLLACVDSPACWGVFQRHLLDFSCWFSAVLRRGAVVERKAYTFSLEVSVLVQSARVGQYLQRRQHLVVHIGAGEPSG